MTTRLPAKIRAITKHAFAASLTKGLLDYQKIVRIVALLRLQRTDHALMALKHYRQAIASQVAFETATITTAITPSAPEKNAWARRLTSLYPHLQSCRVHTDASLVGGAIIQIGDMVYDHSIKGKLALLEGVNHHG